MLNARRCTVLVLLAGLSAGCRRSHDDSQAPSQVLAGAHQCFEKYHERDGTADARRMVTLGKPELFYKRESAESVSDVIIGLNCELPSLKHDSSLRRADNEGPPSWSLTETEYEHFRICRAESYRYYSDFNEETLRLDRQMVLRETEGATGCELAPR